MKKKLATKEERDFLRRYGRSVLNLRGGQVGESSRHHQSGSQPADFPYVQFADERNILQGGITIRHYRLHGTANHRNLIDHLTSFGTIISQILDQLSVEIDSEDRILMAVWSNTTLHPISTPFKHFDQFTSSLLLAAIMRAAISGMGLNFEDEIHFIIKHVRMSSTVEEDRLRGGIYRRRYSKISLQMAVHDRRCIIKTIGADNLCVAKALIIGVAFNNYMKCENNQLKEKLKRLYNKLRKSRGESGVLCK